MQNFFEEWKRPFKNSTLLRSSCRNTLYDSGRKVEIMKTIIKMHYFTELEATFGESEW